MKAEFHNPLHDPAHPDGHVPSPTDDDPSSLPVDDLEFSPTPFCPPKLLFPEARRGNHARLMRSSKRKGDDDGEKKPEKKVERDEAEDEGPSTPKPRQKSRTAPTQGKQTARSRSRSAHKSEWDTSDEEDEPQRGRSRNGKSRDHDDIDGVKPRFPVNAIPIREEVVREEVNEKKREVVKGVGKREMERIARMAPLLVEGAEER